ncbi:MAG: cobyric acid synthase [Clostridiales Family XIII bacterium]|jgi:adenosylcobyric acid synthase|nr:cobyric acid synthase [Clostridiales Family XIII bacterium]
MTKSLMVLGTASNAGKSLLTAGLCRIFRQDGLSAAPFKAQNMALNSFITREGLEIGRAQAMQAEAAGIEPTSDMNPILLKPMTDVGCQVIVDGEVYCNTDAVGYYAQKKEVAARALAAFERLAAKHDVIVLEGAGSPAEINLRDNDIVNLAMARAAGAPCLLAGDIDRGGVFASIAGTQLLLTEDERALLKGIVINKFRGDVTLLEPGLRMIEEITKIPVVGVVPYMRVDIDDEDSLTEHLRGRSAKDEGRDVAVVRLPHLSNFTDFAALERMDGVRVRYVERAADLGSPDLIVLPGTKNTMGDLRVIRENGLEAAILARNAAGTPVFGVCGGYQMLGEMLSDPCGVEGGGEMPGMGLLPMRTVFSERKTRTRVSGAIRPLDGGPFASMSGRAIEGYEIHMGETTGSAPPFADITDAVTGAASADGAVLENVAGTYVHGVFDALVPGYDAYRASQYDLLADTLRANLDMDLIYEIMNKGV